MENYQELITSSTEETKKFAEEFAKTLKGGEVLTLFGNLGYGKTTFVQGIAKGLGIDHNITSPTFIIMRSYTGKARMLYHIDLYRTESEGDVRELGLRDLIDNSENIVVIEWPERMGDLLPKKRIDLRFEFLGEDKRKISITRVGI